MLDIKSIRENPDKIKERLKLRGGDVWQGVDEALAIDEKRRATETEKQHLQSERNRTSREIGIAKKQGGDTSAIEVQMRGIGSRIDELNQETTALDARQEALLLGIPNLPHDACPVGADADANPEVRRWGVKPEFAFPPKDHVHLAKELGLVDFEAGVKVTGSAFVVYRGKGAKLERALINFLLDLHTTRHGYTEVLPPFLVNTDALVGTTQLPKFADQLYHCQEDNLYLAPTAEVPVTNLHREEIL
jgi:seryl-tRNA synthetase